MTRALILVIPALALVSCFSGPMGVLPEPPHPAPTMPASFKTADEVLYEMRAGCYFCPGSATYLNECTMIRTSSRAAAKLMRLSDLADHLEPAGIPPAWHASPSTRVWVAAVAGTITVPAQGGRIWAVFVLPYEPGMAPQIAAIGPYIDDHVGPVWPPYYDALPDLSKS